MRPVQHFGGRGATSPIGRRRPPYALQCSLEHRWYWSRGQSMAAQPCKVPACGVWGAGTVQATGVAPCARALASDHASAACIIPRRERLGVRRDAAAKDAAAAGVLGSQLGSVRSDLLCRHCQACRAWQRQAHGCARAGGASAGELELTGSSTIGTSCERVALCRPVRAKLSACIGSVREEVHEEAHSPPHQRISAARVRAQSSSCACSKQSGTAHQ
jgi:hypothetical protein